jgi:hypothetical protein
MRASVNYAGSAAADGVQSSSVRTECSTRVMMEPDEIARRVRQMCEAGRLPRSEENVHIGSGLGEGQLCDICGELIERQAVAMVLRVTMRVDRVFRLHPRCFLVWRRHCQANA